MNTRKTRSAVNILLLFISIFLNSECCAWPSLDLPRDARLTVVSDEIIFNGVVMKSWSINSWDPQQKTLEFYRNLWRESVIENAPGYLEYEVQGWKVLSRLQNGYQITIQLDKDQQKTTSGLIGISRIKSSGRAPRANARFPVPGIANVFNDITAIDLNKKSRTVVAVTDASVRRVTNFYRKFYKQKGWQEQTKNADYSGHDGFALMFSKRGKELNISINENKNETSIVAVFVDY